jgi:RNA polymerase sigma factor (sigma-70 family)
LPYVIHIAKEFRGRGLPFEDVIAEGCVGLLKAIRRYRAANGTRFMTYASFWVRKEILAAVADQPHAIHVTRYGRRQGHDAVRVLRLDGPVTPDGNQTLMERLRHPDPLPAETILKREQRRQLKREMLRLVTREQAVIAWRYGLDGQDPKTLNEIARRLGLSKERVRQIEVSALAHLRAAISRHEFPAICPSPGRDLSSTRRGTSDSDLNRAPRRRGAPCASQSRNRDGTA